MRSQLLVSRWFQENGFPSAESTGSGRAGVDILGTVGLAIEVKARTGFDPLAWLRQAHEYEDQGIPTVIFRPNGMGEQSVGQWGVLLRLSEYTKLVRQAGYGSLEEQSADHQEDAHQDEGGKSDVEQNKEGSGTPLTEGVGRRLLSHEQDDSK